jgi:hypothetical protein
MLKAGELASGSGVYRCACCSQRRFMDAGELMERCTTCHCSLFQSDFRSMDIEFLSEHRRHLAVPVCARR